MFSNQFHWVVQFNHGNRTYNRSSKSTRKRDALELERQMRQQLVNTKLLGHREHIKLHEACDDLLKTSKDSGAYGSLVTATNRFKDYFDNIFLYRSKVSNDDYNRHRTHNSLHGGTPSETAGGIPKLQLRLSKFGLQTHCRGLFQLPIAA